MHTRGFSNGENSGSLEPVQLAAFENLVKRVNDFWLTKARLPQTQ